MISLMSRLLFGTIFLIHFIFCSSNLKDVKITQQEIGHYDIVITTSQEKESKTFYLYTDEDPRQQAKIFCEEHGIHPQGLETLMDASESIYEGYFSEVKLYDNHFIDNYCNASEAKAIGSYAECKFPLNDLYLLRRTKKERKTTKVPFSPAPYVGEPNLNPKITMIPTFLERIFLIKNVCVTSYGQIFVDSYNSSSKYVKRYKTGKMYDDDDETLSSVVKTSETSDDSQTKMSLVVNPIDLNEKRMIILIVPYANHFGHEFLELFPQLYMLRDVLIHNPEIKVLVNQPLSATKMFPILNAMGIFPDKLNYFSWNSSRETVYCLNEIITTTSVYANHVNPAYVAAFREALCRLPLSNPDLLHMRGDGILFADRRHQPGRRNLKEGEAIFLALEERYGDTLSPLFRGSKHRPVRLLVGNESLEDTIFLFRSSRIFISVHGAQMSNMMFINPGSVVVEIQPYQWTECSDVFLNLAPALGVTPYRYTSKSGGHWTETSVGVEHFLDRIMTLIDSLD